MVDKDQRIHDIVISVLPQIYASQKPCPSPSALYNLYKEVYDVVEKAFTEANPPRKATITRRT